MLCRRTRQHATRMPSEAFVLNDDTSSAVQTPPDPDEKGYQQRVATARQGVVQIVLTSLLVVVAFASGWFGNSYVNRDNYVAPNSDEHLVVQAWDIITNNYAVRRNVNTQKMAYAAIQAMVQTLQDTGHTRFLTKAEYDAEQKSLNNAPTTGIGVYLTGGSNGQPFSILAIVPGSPADKNGQLKPGDEIVAVDGKSTTGLTFDQLRGLITGKAGTPVTLTVRRAPATTGGQPRTLDVTLTRGQYTAPIVTSYIIPSLNIAHIQISQFADGADSQLRTALKDAKARNVKGIVLDLRDNPGGYLSEAVSVASEFIKAGPNKNVMIEQSPSGRQVEAVQPGGLATDIPLAILVNGNTASAAEIVAGAINVHRPEVPVIGEKTFGTGTVLEPFTLADGSVIVLGTSEFLLPNGQSIYNQGLEPDQVVPLPKDATPVSPLVSKQGSYTVQDIEKSGDTQLIKALEDLTGQNLEQKPAA